MKTLETRGRPRSEEARAAVLEAVLKIVADLGAHELSLETISKKANVSRPTLYRWWSNKGEILLEALLIATDREARYSNTGVLCIDLQQHGYRYVKLLNGPYGNAYRAVFAEGLGNPVFLAQVRDKLILPRRELTKVRLKQAIEVGELNSATDIEALIDALYAPFIYRLLLQHQKLDKAFVDQLISQVMRGVL